MLLAAAFDAKMPAGTSEDQAGGGRAGRRRGQAANFTNRLVFMHLQIVVAFVLLLWWLTHGGSAVVTHPAWVLAIVWGKVPLFAGVAWIVQRSALLRLQANRSKPQQPLTYYHWGMFALRMMILGCVVVDLFLTRWPDLLLAVPVLGAIPGVAALCALAPYFVTLIATLWVVFPMERASRNMSVGPARWTKSQYIVFHIRHQMLIVSLPLSIIVVAYVATRDYGDWLARKFGFAGAPDVTLGAVAVAVFVLAPVMLRFIWPTSPLPDGPLRGKLLDLCERIGLNVREILVWHSGGVMVNAAVMGLFPRVRYILLSDALLDVMSDKEIEAVFGHEAGHVRHHHIQYFLLFALISTLIVSGLIEVLVRVWDPGNPAGSLTNDEIQLIGLLAAVPLWGILFGWISRRFERQADTFGAMCATPVKDEPPCRLPCPVHDDPGRPPEGAICSTGASVFLEALRKVAVLNGIPPEERSWRHSSIASRMRFLTRLSGDPVLSRRFHRLVRWIKLGLVVGCIGGGLVAAWYVWGQPDHREQVIRALTAPLRRLGQ